MSFISLFLILLLSFITPKVSTLSKLLILLFKLGILLFTSDCFFILLTVIEGLVSSITSFGPFFIKFAFFFGEVFLDFILLYSPFNSIILICLSCISLFNKSNCFSLSFISFWWLYISFCLSFNSFCLLINSFCLLFNSFSWLFIKSSLLLISHSLFFNSFSLFINWFSLFNNCSSLFFSSWDFILNPFWFSSELFKSFSFSFNKFCSFWIIDWNLLFKSNSLFCNSISFCFKSFSFNFKLFSLWM